MKKGQACPCHPVAPMGERMRKREEDHSLPAGGPGVYMDKGDLRTKAEMPGGAGCGRVWTGEVQRG